MDARGRTYYVDHNSRTTTWQRPTVESVNNYNQWRSNQERNVSREREQYQQRYLSLVIIFDDAWMPYPYEIHINYHL